MAAVAGRGSNRDNSMASVTAYILFVVALVAPPLAVFLPLGMAPLLGLAALALLVADGRRCLQAARTFAGLAACLVLLSLWGMASALWSPIPGHSLFEGGRLLVITVGGLILLGAGASLGAEEAQRLARGSLLGVALAVLLLQIELRAGQPLLRLFLHAPDGAALSPAHYDRGVTVLLLAAWPALAALAARRRGWGVALLILAVGDTVLISISHASMAGLVLGAAALPLAWWRPRLAAGGLVVGVAAIALIFPLVAPDGRAIERLHEAAPRLQSSAIHRLAIWRFTADRIGDRPILGWGMDASRALPGGKERVNELMPQLELSDSAEALPLHPHDAPLQWRVELGLPGTLLAVAALAWSLHRVASDRLAPRWCRALALGYAAAVLTVAALSFGAWQAWWLCAVWLTAALFVATRRGIAAEG
jgi:O-antigen ligase